jgi:23S rRNA (guanosine2251-2'-O)-methyltransferase
VKTETLYGFHSVIEAFKAGRRTFLAVYIAKNQASRRIQKITAFTENLKIPLKTVNPSQLRAMVGSDLHQGLAARVSPYPLVPLDEIIGARLDSDNHPFLLLLDHIVDPRNLGALIRTGLAVGANGIILTRDRSAPLSPAVSKSSAGALEHAHVVGVTNMVRTIEALKESGLWVIGMDHTAQRSIYTHDFKGPIGIVIGAEEKGIRPLVKKHCDFLLSIPQKGVVDSLNASVAGAVVLYEAFRQRSHPTGQ